MKDKEVKKFIIIFTFITFLMACSCISGLIESKFSVDSIKLAINTFVPILVGFGWVCYFTIKNKVKPLGDFAMKLKITILGTLIIISLFIFLHIVLGTKLDWL